VEPTTLGAEKACAYSADYFTVSLHREGGARKGMSNWHVFCVNTEGSLFKNEFGAENHFFDTFGGACWQTGMNHL